MKTLILMAIILSVTSMESTRSLEGVGQIGPNTLWAQVGHLSYMHTTLSNNDQSLLKRSENLRIENCFPEFHYRNLNLLNMQQTVVTYTKLITPKAMNTKTRKDECISFSMYLQLSSLLSYAHKEKLQCIICEVENPIHLLVLTCKFNLNYSNLQDQKHRFCFLAMKLEMSWDKGLTFVNKSSIEASFGSISSVITNSCKLQLLSKNGNSLYSRTHIHKCVKDVEVFRSKNRTKPFLNMVKLATSLRTKYINKIKSTNGFVPNLFYDTSFKIKAPLQPAMEPAPEAPSGEAPNGSFTPSMAPSPAPAPDTSPFSNYLNINDRTAYLAKVLGTIIGILLLVMLLCSILVGFSQFGFACIANPEDLIELEFSTLGEFGRFEEESELKVLESMEKEVEPQKGGHMQRLLGKIKEATNESDSHESYSVVGNSRKQSVWRSARASRGSYEDELLKVKSSVALTTSQTNVHQRNTSASIAGMGFGLIRPSKPIQDPYMFPQN
jgi:hypothetical protein